MRLDSNPSSRSIAPAKLALLLARTHRQTLSMSKQDASDHGADKFKILTVMARGYRFAGVFAVLGDKEGIALKSHLDTPNHQMGAISDQHDAAYFRVDHFNVEDGQVAAHQIRLHQAVGYTEETQSPVRGSSVVRFNQYLALEKFSVFIDTLYESQFIQEGQSAHRFDGASLIRKELDDRASHFETQIVKAVKLWKRMGRKPLLSRGRGNTGEFGKKLDTSAAMLWSTHLIERTGKPSGKRFSEKPSSSGYHGSF